MTSQLVTFLIKIIIHKTIGFAIVLRHYKRTVLTERQIWLRIIAILINLSYINIIETIITIIRLLYKYNIL